MATKKSGFTLIELVIVLVVLAVLAVIAIPRFLNMDKEARRSSLEAGIASLKSANDMVYAKASIEGKENLMPNEYHNPTDASIIVNGRRVDLSYGRMMASKWNIETVADFPKDDWKIVQARGGHFGLVYLMPQGAPSFNMANATDIAASKCYLSYSFKQYDYHTPIYDMAYEGC